MAVLPYDGRWSDLTKFRPTAALSTFHICVSFSIFVLSDAVERSTLPAAPTRLGRPSDHAVPKRFYTASTTSRHSLEVARTSDADRNSRPAGD
jgi:hypothetical protein